MNTTKRFNQWISVVVLVTVFTLTSCVRPSSTGPRAWIDSPRAGASIPLGTPITVISHAYARAGLSEIVLYVDGQAYQHNPPAEPGAAFSEIHQDWLPDEPGTYMLQVRAYDINGDTGNPAAIAVSVVDGLVVDALVEEPLPSATDTSTPEVSETPTLTLTPTLTPTSKPTFTPTLTLTFTPTNTPVPVDNTPPPVPVPVVPADGLILSCRLSQTLAWTLVTDPSGIQGYYVELEKEITAGQWDDAGQWGPLSDKQVNVPVSCGIRYRWVVSAEDGAGNFSNWSTISHFAVELE